MEYKKGETCSFLLQYQVLKGSDYTHTSILKPIGSFYIPSEKLDDFYSIYKNAVKYNDDLYITEKHRDISPILIDLDFRFAKAESLERRYNSYDILQIVKIYDKYIREYIDIGEYKIYVMQKPGPVVNKDLEKDGLHIVIPEIVTKPVVQYLIRAKVLKEFELLFNHLELQNNYEDVIDEAVIERNNWQMYGSKKPNCEKYSIVNIFNSNENSLLIEDKNILSDEQYVELFSIRNKYDETFEKIEKKNEIFNYTEELRRIKKMKLTRNNIIQKNPNIKENTCTDIEIVKKYVLILNSNRINSYNSWINLGWCLRNIDINLLDTWIEISKKSPKFKEGECEKMWRYMKEDGLGIGTLCMWAKQDSPQEYEEIRKKDINSLICKSVCGSHHDVANVIYFIYKYEYVCASISKNYWYEFKDHRWIECDHGYSLRAKLSTEITKEYQKQANFWSIRAANTDEDEEKEEFEKKAKKFKDIIQKLKTTSFKDNIMKECKELFYINKFDERLDSRINLIGFCNGVYDLDLQEFRSGRPDDCVSYSTGIDYIEYNSDNENTKELNAFLSQVLTLPHIKEYVLLLFASFLSGSVKEEKFHIWTGSGCFAKGTQVMMFDGKNKSIENIVEGDLLMGDDSTPRTVKELFRGYSDMYRIKPIKGEDFIVNGEHDLVVKMSNCFKVNKRDNQYRASWIEYVDDNRVIKNTSVTISTKEGAIKILENAKKSEKSVKTDDIVKMTVHQYLELPNNIKILMSVYRPEIVKFEKKEVTLDPYLLGYWLGDGSQYDPAFTTEDIEVVDYVKELMKENSCNMNVYAIRGSAKTYGISRNKNESKVNYVRKGLQDYNLFKNKHIPDDFKVNDKETRLSVLAGIIDSDGHYQKKMKQIEITLKSEKLIDDVIWLARSLGMSCYKHKIKKTCCNNGKVGDYFRINIVGKSLCEIPTKIPRKKPDMRTCPRDPLKLGFKVERVEDNDFYGFELDGNHRFILGNFIIQKNSNGKSKIIELFEQSFGDYCCKLPITLLTGKRAASNAATSEIARIKGKRFACFQEPGPHEEINVGLMKELTGGDKIQARSIYKEPVEFKPQVKQVLTCNDLPTIPSDDGGTWRRIRVVEFTSKFTDKPDPEKKNEFMIDKEVSDKFSVWKEYFMGLLVHYYGIYITEGIVEPDEVIKYTLEYQRRNDIFSEFMEQECEKTDNEKDVIAYPDLFAKYKFYCKENNIAMSSNAKKHDYIKSFSKVLGRAYNVRRTDMWKGWKLANNNDFEDDIS